MIDNVGSVRWVAVSMNRCQNDPAKLGVPAPIVARIRPLTIRAYDGIVRSTTSKTITAPQPSPVRTAARTACSLSRPPSSHPTPTATAEASSASSSRLSQEAHLGFWRNGVRKNCSTLDRPAITRQLYSTLRRVSPATSAVTATATPKQSTVTSPGPSAGLLNQSVADR